MIHNFKPSFNISPSQYLREKRPELFSDSTKVQKFRIRKEVLDHQLSTLTERNQYKDFENFCRKIAEIEICHNLRPQTGPEGGGDGKVDCETYPVSDEVALTWYTGCANSNSERWAFAFSTKKDWREKVKKDVEKIISTDRGYSRIHFFTNQNPSQKERLELESKLSDQFRIPITIYERSWLIEKTIDSDHTDVAYETLGIGECNAENIKKGPLDTARIIELDDLEETIAKVESSGSSYFNLVASALRAAELSRELELPRVYIDGKFSRAIEYADKHGTSFQQFLARYQYARTLFWWFDEIEETHEKYEDLEERALKNLTSETMELLSCILDGLASYQTDFTKIDFHIEKRSETLRTNLSQLASDRSRPNQSLHARTLLSLRELNSIVCSGKSADLDTVFENLTKIIEESKGLGEYPAMLIQRISQNHKNNRFEGQAYDRLVSAMAQFKGHRKNEGEQGKDFLLRGQQLLESGKPMEAINWLGKATIAFSKEEFRDKQVETTFCLALAYARANVFWAARATILSCLCTIKSLSDQSGKFHDRIFSATELFCLVCTHIGHLPDTLLAFDHLRLFEIHVKVPEEELNSYIERFMILEQTLAETLISLDESQLNRLTKIPEVLKNLGLIQARAVMMLKLGRYEQLKQESTDETGVLVDTIEVFKREIADKASAKKLPSKIILNDEKSSIFRTNIINVEVEFNFQVDDNSISICEYLISGLEAFAVNLYESGVYPQTNYANVSLDIVTSATSIEVEVESLDHTVVVKWPKSLNISDLSKAGAFQQGLHSFIVAIIDLISIPDDLGKKVFGAIEHNQLFERCSIFSNTSVTHGRLFGQTVSKISDLYPIAGIEKSE